MSRPDVLYRVEFVQGNGWPECTEKVRTKRTYESARAAAVMVAEIRRLPDHHELIGVYRCEPVWSDATASVGVLAEMLLVNETLAEEIA